MLSSGKVDTFKSPLIVESVRVGRARDCWQMVREGVVVRKELGGPSTAQAKRGEDDDDVDVGAGPSSCVASHAWGVVEWWIELFEVDERIGSMEQGSGAHNFIYLSDSLDLIHLKLSPRSFFSHTSLLGPERALHSGMCKLRWMWCVPLTDTHPTVWICPN
jgi:hypothetical protein